MAEDEMVGWHHRLNGHEFEQAPGVGDGQGSLACCSPWGHKESDTAERLTEHQTKEWFHIPGRMEQNGVRFHQATQNMCNLKLQNCLFPDFPFNIFGPRLIWLAEIIVSETAEKGG